MRFKHQNWGLIRWFTIIPTKYNFPIIYQQQEILDLLLRPQLKCWYASTFKYRPLFDSCISSLHTHYQGLVNVPIEHHSTIGNIIPTYIWFGDVQNPQKGTSIPTLGYPRPSSPVRNPLRNPGRSLASKLARPLHSSGCMVASASSKSLSTWRCARWRGTVHRWWMNGWWMVMWRSWLAKLLSIWFRVEVWLMVDVYWTTYGTLFPFQTAHSQYCEEHTSQKVAKGYHYNPE